jgi:prevent-host-death family protein
MNVSIKDAKELLDELVRRAETGEHVVLTREGKRVAELGPVMPADETRPRLLGAMKGQTWIADDFDELGPEWDEYVK